MGGVHRIFALSSEPTDHGWPTLRFFGPAVLGIVLAALAQGCFSDGAGYQVPGVVFDASEPLYLVHEAGDEHQLAQMVANQLRARGFDIRMIDSGGRLPAEAKYSVHYAGKWQWSITWFLIDFQARIYEEPGQLLVASGSSRPSFPARQSPGVMVAVVLDSLLQNSRGDDPNANRTP